MVQIHREFTSDGDLIVEYGFPHAKYHECDDVLRRLLGSSATIEPVPIPKFKGNSTIPSKINKVIKAIKAGQQTSKILTGIGIGIGALVFIAFVVGCLYFRANVITVVNMARRIIN